MKLRMYLFRQALQKLRLFAAKDFQNWMMIFDSGQVLLDALALVGQLDPGRAFVMHQYAGFADVVDVLAVDFEVVDPVSARWAGPDFDVG